MIQAVELSGDSTNRDLEILNNAMGKIKENNPDFNFKVGTPSNVDYGTTIRPPSSSSGGPSNDYPVYGEWEKIIGNLYKLIPNATNIEAGITKQGYMIISYLPFYNPNDIKYHRLLVIDLNTMKNVTVEMNMHRAGLKGDGANTARLAVNEQGNNAILCFANPFTFYNIDLDSKEVTKLETRNQIDQPTSYSNLTVNRQPYLLRDQLFMITTGSINGSLQTHVDVFTVKSKKVVLEYQKHYGLSIEYQQDASYYIVSGNYFYLKRIKRRELTHNTSPEYRVFRISDGLSITEEDNEFTIPNWQEVLPFKTYNNPRTMNVFGYTLIANNSDYKIIDPVEKTIETISSRSDAQIYGVSNEKHTCYYKGYIYRIPNATEDTVINSFKTARQKASFNEVIRTRVKFKNDGVDQNGIPTSYYVDQSTNSAYRDYINSDYSSNIPSYDFEVPKYENFMNEAYDMSNYVTPALPSTGTTNADLLKDLADSTGMKFYSVGNIVIFETPEVKSLEDFVLDMKYSAEPIEHVKSANIYSSVKIYYGRGASSGVVEIFRDQNVIAGESATTYEQIRPTMNKAQAETYARRILKNGIKEEILISFPYVPNLKVGHTVKVVSQKLLGGSYKGICTAMSLSISPESGAYCHYTLTDYS